MFDAMRRLLADPIGFCPADEAILLAALAVTIIGGIFYVQPHHHLGCDSGLLRPAHCAVAAR